MGLELRRSLPATEHSNQVESRCLPTEHAIWKSPVPSAKVRKPYFCLKSCIPGGQLVVRRQMSCILPSSNAKWLHTYCTGAGWSCQSTSISVLKSFFHSSEESIIHNSMYRYLAFSVPHSRKFGKLNCHFL